MALALMVGGCAVTVTPAAPQIDRTTFQSVGTADLVESPEFLRYRFIGKNTGGSVSTVETTVKLGAPASDALRGQLVASGITISRGGAVVLTPMIDGYQFRIGGKEVEGLDAALWGPMAWLQNYRETDYGAVAQIKLRVIVSDSSGRVLSKITSIGVGTAPKSLTTGWKYLLADATTAAIKDVVSKSVAALLADPAVRERLSDG